MKKSRGSGGLSLLISLQLSKHSQPNTPQFHSKSPKPLFLIPWKRKGNEFSFGNRQLRVSE